MEHKSSAGPIIILTGINRLIFVPARHLILDLSSLNAILFHKALEASLLLVLYLQVSLFGHNIYDVFLSYVGEHRVQEDAEGDPVSIAVVTTAIFCAEGQKVEKLGYFRV